MAPSARCCDKTLRSWNRRRGLSISADGAAPAGARAEFARAAARGPAIRSESATRQITPNQDSRPALAATRYLGARRERVLATVGLDDED